MAEPLNATLRSMVAAGLAKEEVLLSLINDPAKKDRPLLFFIESPRRRYTIICRDRPY